jgi:hypothetical protein
VGIGVVLVLYPDAGKRGDVVIPMPTPTGSVTGSVMT